MKVKLELDRVGSIGALVAAIAAPCCFPLFAAIVGTLGLVGPLTHYESVVLCAFQAFALISLLGLILAFLRHRNIGPLLLGAGSAAALGYSFYGSLSLPVLYAGLFGLLAATLWNHFVLRGWRRSREPLLQSVITCPQCGYRVKETMPTDACLFFYDCPNCHVRLKPKSGDCCVFCSYGSVPCPPVQTNAPCGA